MGQPRRFSWISLVILALMGWALWGVLHWLVVGADWSVVGANLPLYLVGSYPVEARWRPLLWIALLVLLPFPPLVEVSCNNTKRSLMLDFWLSRPGLWRRAFHALWHSFEPI